MGLRGGKGRKSPDQKGGVAHPQPTMTFFWTGCQLSELPDFRFRRPVRTVNKHPRSGPGPAAMENSLESLRLEPPTNDVEICCRFEDIATEGERTRVLPPPPPPPPTTTCSTGSGEGRAGRVPDDTVGYIPEPSARQPLYSVSAYIAVGLRGERGLKTLHSTVTPSPTHPPPDLISQIQPP